MTKTTPWTYIPSLYLAEGIPYAIANLLSVAMYKDFGVSNAEIAFYTAWLYLPWVLKPLWSPFVDVIRTKRWWIIAMELLIGAAIAAVAFSLNAPTWFQISIGLFWLIAFCSSTHDISIDGYYMLALDSSEQSFFVGIRSTFYKISQWVGNGALMIIVGLLQKTHPKIYSWTVVIMIMAGLFIAFMLYHSFILPKVEKPRTDTSLRKITSSIGDVFVTFFRKPAVWITILFILVYRLGEAMLVKMKTPFLIDTLDAGGMGLTLEEYGVIDGTVGMLCMVVGGILGGIALSRKGLKYWLWAMILCMSLPNAAYIYLAFCQPSELWLICTCVGIEQLGYGFGFTCISLYMMYFARGEYATSHFALCTGFMALGMMFPGMIAGYLQQTLGYPLFFCLVFILGLVVMAVLPFLKIDPSFGKKQ